MRSSLCEASAAPLAPAPPAANIGREAKSVVATELPINVRRFMRGIVLLQLQKGIALAKSENSNKSQESGAQNAPLSSSPALKLEAQTKLHDAWRTRSGQVQETGATQTRRRAWICRIH